MKLFTKIKSEVQNFQLIMTALLSNQRDSVQNSVAYVSQFAHPEYAEKILKDGVAKTSDPNWKATGAQSPNEYAEWVLTMCGMACTSMALQHLKNRKEGIVSLAKDAKIYGVYKELEDGLSGMNYQEFADWIRGYGIKAKIYTRLGVHGLRKLLSDGDVVIVSVNPNIREYKTASDTQRGGHLVLITGYNKKDNTLTLHNPSGFVSQNTQENHTVPVARFLKYYAGRGISLSSL